MDRIGVSAHRPDHGCCAVGGVGTPTQVSLSSQTRGHALARDKPNLVVSRSIFNVGMLQTPGGQGGAAAGGPLAENLVSERRGATERRTQKSSNRLSDPDFSTGSTGVLLSGLMRLPEAAAVQ